MINRMLLIVLVAVAGGCVKTPTRIAVHPVSGEVLFGGRPAQGVQVTLYPVNAPMPPDVPKNPTATTDANGKFTLGTYSENDGAAKGDYKILLRWPAPKKPGSLPDSEQPDLLADWYTIDRSTLKFTVSVGPNEIPAIKLNYRAPPLD